MNSMKRKKHTTIIIIGFLALGIPLLIAQPEDIKINNTETYGKKQRPAVNFPHMKHIESIDCMDCHHDYDENGKNILDESQLAEEKNEALQCAMCHMKKRINGTFGLMNAYHKQCIGCHRKMIRNGEKSGPQVCGACHPWK
jgi:hypothetical protein